MNKLLLAHAVAAAIGLFLIAHLPKPQVPEDRDPVLWTKGRKVYQTSCTTCHNVNPDLTGSIGPALRGISQETLVDTFTNGNSTMVAKPELLPLVPALVEYLR